MEIKHNKILEYEVEVAGLNLEGNIVNKIIYLDRWFYRVYKWFKFIPFKIKRFLYWREQTEANPESP